MKTAIAANTQNKDARVAMHAARAPFYLIYEGGVLLDTIKNPYSAIDRGAAPRAAQLLQEQGVESLVAGEFGDRFIDLLKENNIAPVVGNGPISKVIQDIPV